MGDDTYIESAARRAKGVKADPKGHRASNPLSELLFSSQHVEARHRGSRGHGREEGAAHEATPQEARSGSGFADGAPPKRKGVGDTSGVPPVPVALARFRRQNAWNPYGEREIP